MIRPNSKTKQRGAAVIIAILIATLAASTAAFVLWQQSLWVRQLENVTGRSRIDQLSKYLIDVARNNLKKDNTPNTDSLIEWDQALETIIDDVQVKGKVIDAQSRFNINSLVQVTQQGTPPVINNDTLKAFQRLLRQLKLDEKLADNVVNWIQDSQGSADMDYLSLNPPYRTGQKKFADTSELARVKGFTEPVMHALLPYIIALRGDAPVNVNTASEELLNAIFEDQSIAAKIISQRASKAIENVQEFQQPASGSTNTCNGCYDVKSNYFIIQMQAKSGKLESGYEVLISRTGGQSPTVEWQKEITQ